ncbi:LysR family transcriptional regulator [Burkholderia pseudomallei]|uniref:hypothetical protein n=1 Tax=Burkholderia pseudomallei TaxID=28450 RepID=UPI000536A80B|nr:hypothetical protein [Burkholderia pseudomallei]KGV73707.1 transcriptional regulator, LysR family [Burkholderia pseudomallei MSHR4299]ONA06346.1 hypothetical protein AQ876_16545 [Burkholderia pseudomallei]ONB53424.1 hypothetical protein AQ902_13235 [Burkholderia pseudomallei]ONB98119.1 hypothetical protein AQ909_13750 [Burkholderia pseudomallei]CAJ9067983.1 LysR family transcriptional regulator [Burkholderia pseudomallei]
MLGRRARRRARPGVGQPAGGADEGAAASGRASMLHVEGVVYRSVCATPARPVELTLAYRQDNDNPLFGAPKDVPRKSLTASR